MSGGKKKGERERDRVLCVRHEGAAHARARELMHEGRDDGGHGTTSRASVTFPENDVRVGATVWFLELPYALNPKGEP